MTDYLLTALADRWPELLVAGVFAFIGTRWSRLWAHRRLLTRISYELVETQRAMRDRAAPAGGFKRDGAREEWMLEPYVMRVDFLVSLANAEGLGDQKGIAIAAYRDELRAFIRTWAGAKHQVKSFRDAYSVTVDRLEDTLRKLGRRRSYRIELGSLRVFSDERDEPGSSGTSLDALDAGPADAETIRDGQLREPLAE